MCGLARDGRGRGSKFGRKSNSREASHPSCLQVGGREDDAGLRRAERATIFCVDRSGMEAVGKAGIQSDGTVNPSAGPTSIRNQRKGMGKVEE